MSGEVVNLTPKLLLQLKKRETDFLRSMVVKGLYKKEPWKMMAYGVMLRHTNMVDYIRTPGFPNYGVELEYSLRPADYLTRDELKKCLSAGIRKSLIDLGWGTNFSIEEDGTVPDGFEIVLGPRRLEEVLFALRAIGDDRVFREFIDYNADNVGVHITVDKFVHKWQTTMFIDVWNHPWTHTWFGRLIGRKPNQYCHLMERQSDGTYKPDEYGVVNIRENGCLEVRAFRNCLLPNATMAQLQLVHHIDKWIRNGGNDIDKLFEEAESWHFARGISAEKRR